VCVCVCCPVSSDLYGEISGFRREVAEIFGLLHGMGLFVTDVSVLSSRDSVSKKESQEEQFHPEHIDS
jgi:hypothetical protein